MISHDYYYYLILSLPGSDEITQAVTEQHWNDEIAQVAWVDMDNKPRVSCIKSALLRPQKSSQKLLHGRLAPWQTCWVRICLTDSRLIRKISTPQRLKGEEKGFSLFLSPDHYTQHWSDEITQAVTRQHWNDEIP